MHGGGIEAVDRFVVGVGFGFVGVFGVVRVIRCLLAFRSVGSCRSVLVVDAF